MRNTMHMWGGGTNVKGTFSKWQSLQTERQLCLWINNY